MPERVCRACGDPFEASGRGRGRAIRCSDCVRSYRKPKVECTCQRCGNSFEATSAAAKRCPGCRHSGREWAAGRKKYDWTPERDATLRERYDSRVKRALEDERALGAS